jgi:hypothetical protein
MLTPCRGAWFNGRVGQLNPYDQSEDDSDLEISLSGLPEDPEEPELPEGVTDLDESGPEVPEGDFDEEEEELRERSKSGDLIEGEADLSKLPPPDVSDADLDPDVDAEFDELVAEVEATVDGEGDNDSDEEDGAESGAVVVADAGGSDVEAKSDEESDEDDDEDDEELAYDLAEWDNDQLDALFAALDEGEVAYLWDGSELFVKVDDEAAVDAIIERIDAEANADAGGQLLGDLFVVADELGHDPDEHESVARLLRLADASDEATAPYGLDDEVWDGLRERVTALATLLEDEKPDGDEVIAAAGELRQAIRPYV